MNNASKYVIITDKINKRALFLRDLIREGGDGCEMFGRERLFEKNVPLPFENEEVNVVSGPRTDERTAAAIVGRYPRIKKLYCGGVTPECEELLRASGAVHKDIYSGDGFAKKNAVPTAEGTLAEAIRATDFCLNERNVLILGWGRVAKEVYRVFTGIGAFVTAALRDREKAARIVSAGGSAIILENGAIPESADLSAFSVVINTIPYPGVLDEKTLGRMKNAVYIELARSDAPEKAAKSGIRCISAAGLPSVYAPRDAARYIYEALTEER